MRKRTGLSRKSLLLGFALLACAFIVTQCGEPPRDISVSATESEYSFDPGTIQQSIMNGRQNVFQLEWERDLYRAGSETRAPETFEKPTPAPNRLPLSWGEADFERVVQASIDFSSKEPTSGSRLSKMFFLTPCRYANIGPQRMMFDFFKVILAQEGNRYFSRTAIADIETGHLTWVEAELIEVQYEEQALDRSVSYIPAETALRIAESVGGIDFRTEHRNACSVSGYLTAGVADSEWRVVYTLDTLPITTFEVQIDKETGEGKIIKTPTP